MPKMASRQHNDDDSFIILGSSPGTSLDLQCNGLDAGDIGLDKLNLDDAMKDLPEDASMAFKAHFKLGDCPSPGNLMLASNIITDDKSTEDLQKQFGELLDENVILKETLKQNNASMKEQFLLIASCQEDIMRTHMVHKDRFNETRDLVERLRLENKKLKQDIARLTEAAGQTSQPNSQGTVQSSSSSALEFVSSPDDDTINKLTAQLELIEKQRRQVIQENEKLTWQKESLEHIVDATSKERDDLKEKLENVELRLSMSETENLKKIKSLNYTVMDLNNKLKAANSSATSDELAKRDNIIGQLESKISQLQSDLKTAQLKILDLENVKLEFSKYKLGVSDTVKIYKEQIQELHNKLKEAQTAVFQPVRFSLSTEPESSSSQHASLIANVKLYDKSLKHLAELLNLVTHGATDSLVELLVVIASLQDFKLERTSVEQFKNGLADVKKLVEKQHATAQNNICQIKSTITIFEGIFKDYNDLLKNVLCQQTNKPAPSMNVEALTTALVARGMELQTLQDELKTLKADKEEKEVLKAQLELYRSDFEAEREAREKMACEKENIMTDLRTAQRRIEELVSQLEEVRKLNPNIFRSATAKRPQSASSSSSPAHGAPRRTSNHGNHGNGATGNMVYTCPKCMKFSCDQYKVMEDHFDFCLDD